MEIEINFKKLQKCLGDSMPLKRNENGSVSLSTCNNEWASRRLFCSEKMFIEEIEDYIKDKGIEEFIASHMLNTQFIFPKH
ncbi:MAG: hypothetical protein IJV85_04525 [Clostridia bacterium]|nr:hypothetical protein [Schwartzia sp. (in: firmicutes)]MBQ9728842.1 hypothetical protein [Clostridia bacterium]